MLLGQFGIYMQKNKLTSQNLWDLGLGKKFLDMAYKA